MLVYLFHCQAVVQYDNSVSDEMEVLSGVPHGSILGPMLFLLILNDMTDVILRIRHFFRW